MRHAALAIAQKFPCFIVTSDPSSLLAVNIDTRFALQQTRKTSLQPAVVWPRLRPSARWRAKAALGSTHFISFYEKISDAGKKVAFLKQVLATRKERAAGSGGGSALAAGCAALLAGVIIPLPMPYR